jgi:hypothetical protein
MNADLLKKTCLNLLSYDGEIVEIVQFGSSVYAPQYAKDVDLLVMTRRMKDYGGYLDAANEDIESNVDVAVFEVGQKLRQYFLRNILGAFNILHGDGRYLLEYAKALDDPTLEEAKSSLRVASSLMKLASETSNIVDKDRLTREAFDAIFHAARIASMVFLSTEVSKWGLMRRKLPEPHKSRFYDFANTLHIRYFYNGDYPKERVEEEFNMWLNRAKEYVNELESRTKGK